MPKSLLVVVFIFWSPQFITKSFAQVKRDTLMYPMIFKSDTLFAYPNGVWTDTVNKANAFRFIINPDTINSMLSIVNDLYPNGNLKLQSKSSVATNAVLFQGICTEYYSNGHIKSVLNYKDNIRIGNAIAYYPNGKLYYSGIYGNKGSFAIFTCRDSSGNEIVSQGNGEFIKYDPSFKKITDRGRVEETQKTGEWKHFTDGKLLYSLFFEKGAFKSGIGYDSLGKAYPFINVDESATYKGGIDELSRFVTSNLKYARSSKTPNSFDIVLVRFDIEKNGVITNVKITQSLDAEIDREIINGIKQSSKLWTPRKLYGIPVKTNFYTAIHFISDN